MEITGPLSKTSIGDFATCPWLYYALRILKRERVVGIAAMNGIESHDLVHQIITKDLSLEDAALKASNANVRDIVTLTNSWWPLDELRQKFKAGALQVEQTVFTTKTGKRVKTRRSALLTGIVDLAEEIDGVGYVHDWKSGNWEKDSEIERHLYAGVIGPALFPDAQKIVFTLRFMKTGNMLQSVYQFSSTLQTVIVTDPTGETTLHSAEMNPFLEMVQGIAQEIKDSPPTPKHGKWCKSMYGSPCQFYADATCPYWEKKLKKEE